MQNSTERFSKTVDDYVKYRPSYPVDVVEVMQKVCGLTPQSTIADVGSGTGFLSKLFLDAGNSVYGVEPNTEMRMAAELSLKSYKHFHSVNGTAEITGLNANSIDLITVGTAFHWFDVEKTKVEFQRILKAPQWVLLVWNVRDLEHSALMRDYEIVLQEFGTDYCQSKASEFDKTALGSFFPKDEMQTQAFKNVQLFDWIGLQGRLQSTSYSLRPGDARYDEMMMALKKIYDRHQVEGVVEFLYQTKLYFGRL